MSLEWARPKYKKESSNNFETVELTISKGTIKTAKRKAKAYKFRDKENVLQEAISEGIEKVF